MKKKFFLFNLPWIAARHAFLTCIIVFLISFIIGGIIFCKNYFNIEAKKNNVVSQGSYFDEKAHLELIEFWQEKEKRFIEADSKIYPNPFVLTEEKK